MPDDKAFDMVVSQLERIEGKLDQSKEQHNELQIIVGKLEERLRLRSSLFGLLGGVLAVTLSLLVNYAKKMLHHGG